MFIARTFEWTHSQYILNLIKDTGIHNYKISYSELVYINILFRGTNIIFVLMYGKASINLFFTWKLFYFTGRQPRQP